jgi:hypothetical protein
MALDERRTEVRRTDVAIKTPDEITRDRREAAVTVDVALKVILVTLLWLVSVPLLIGWELTAPAAPARPRIPGLTAAGLGAAPSMTGNGSGAGYVLAAVLAVLLPFVASVIATRNRRFVAGGAYVVLTLAMVVPAISIANAAG